MSGNMRTVEAVIERIKIVYNARKDADLARHPGIKANTISTWKDRGSVPLKKLDQISQSENVSMEWLLNGRGSMHVDARQNAPTAAKSRRGLRNKDHVSITCYEDIESAVHPYAMRDTLRFDTVMTSKTFLSTMFKINSFSDLSMVTVAGDLLEPFVHNGETVIMQRMSSALNNDLAILRIGKEVMLRRMLKDPMGRWAKLVSEHPDHPDIDLLGMQQNVEIIGVVHGKIRPF